jgi:hypothetical protein
MSLTTYELCGVSAPELVAPDLGMRCELERGHTGDHYATDDITTLAEHFSLEVSWRNRTGPTD